MHFPVLSNAQAAKITDEIQISISMAPMQNRQPLYRTGHVLRTCGHPTEGGGGWVGWWVEAKWVGRSGHFYQPPPLGICTPAPKALEEKIATL